MSKKNQLEKKLTLKAVNGKWYLVTWTKSKPMIFLLKIDLSLSLIL